MTQEQKDLLLKDLCARLPYGIKVEYENEIFDVEYVCPMYEEVKLDIPETWTIDVSEVKPYLFPLSSMTEEQKHELNILSKKECEIIEDVVNNPTPSNVGFPVVVHYMIDWCSKNHFDYQGIIPMGLANDATGKTIY